MLNRARMALRVLFARRVVESEMEKEMRLHIDMETEQNIRRGLSPMAARRAALVAFGGVEQAKETTRDERSTSSMDEIMRDLRQAFRGLKRTPAFLATSVITLALAIGAVTGMFGVVNTVLLRPLPFPNPERLVKLEGTAPGSDLPARFGVGNEFYLHYKQNSTLIDGIFTFRGGTATLRVGDRVERVGMGWQTNDMYATLGVRPQLGRLPVIEDRDDAVVLSDRAWAAWFNRDSSVLGKWYFVSDSMKQVIGVMPKGFTFPNAETMLWISVALGPANVRAGNFGGFVVARMKPGVTEEQLDAEFKQLAMQLPARFGATPAYTKVIDQFRPINTELRAVIVGSTLKSSLLVLLGAVAAVLLVACANVANLFMVRAETRRRDFAVRRAIGASRAQLVRFQLAEAFVVALIAGFAAVVLAAVALPTFVRAAPDGIPRLADVRMDLPTLAVAFLLVVLVAMACGVVPALRASTPDLGGLREGSRGDIGGRAWRRDVLVVAQTALALVLLIGSALLVQSFNRLRNVDPGYDVRDIYTFQIAPDQPRLRDGSSFGQLHLSLLERIRALPGVTAVGVVNNIPLDEATGSSRAFPEGMSTDNAGIPIALNYTGGDYFKAAGIRLLRGRAFLNEEAITPNNSAILSKSAAEKLFPGQEAVGRRLRPRVANQDTLAFTVVGVVNDVKQTNWRDAGEAVIYLPLTGPTPHTWRVTSPAYVVKSPRADGLKEEIRRLVKEVAPEAPVFREFTMEFMARRSMLQLSFTALTLGVLSALALMLGAVGLYGTLSYVVAQRTREIGVRMALGATAGAVRREIVSQGTKVVLIGTVIGIVVAYLTTKYLSTLLYEVKAVNPIVFAVMSAMMVGIGVLASYMPAQRASRVAPMEALRGD